MTRTLNARGDITPQPNLDEASFFLENLPRTSKERRLEFLLSASVPHVLMYRAGRLRNTSPCTSRCRNWIPFYNASFMDFALNTGCRPRRIVDCFWRLFFRWLRCGWIDLGNDRLRLRRLLGTLRRNNGRFFGWNIWLGRRFGFGSQIEILLSVCPGNQLTASIRQEGFHRSIGRSDKNTGRY
jgi:hypothetical protein